MELAFAFNRKFVLFVKNHTRTNMTAQRTSAGEFDEKVYVPFKI